MYSPFGGRTERAKNVRKMSKSETSVRSMLSYL